RRGTKGLVAAAGSLSESACPRARGRERRGSVRVPVETGKVCLELVEQCRRGRTSGQPLPWAGSRLAGKARCARRQIDHHRRRTVGLSSIHTPPVSAASSRGLPPQATV